MHEKIAKHFRLPLPPDIGNQETTVFVAWGDVGLVEGFHIVFRGERKEDWLLPTEYKGETVAN